MVTSRQRYRRRGPRDLRHDFPLSRVRAGGGEEPGARGRALSPRVGATGHPALASAANEHTV